jgi:hypothetical protein
MMHEFEDTSYKVGRSYLCSMKGEGGWREGIFNHPLGLVRVFESMTPQHQATSMYFHHLGRSHHRRWAKVWGEKTLARLAREFVEHVVGHSIGASVRKPKGSNWHGTVVGYYATKLTPKGVAVESDYEEGSVQIYPAHALESWS